MEMLFLPPFFFFFNLTSKTPLESQYKVNIYDDSEEQLTAMTLKKEHIKFCASKLMFGLAEPLLLILARAQEG